MITCLWVILAARPLHADDPPAPAAATADTAAPTLAEIDRLRLTEALQQLEILRLRAQLIEQDTAHTRDRVAALLRALDRPGFELDLSTWTYRPTTTPPPAAPAR